MADAKHIISFISRISIWGVLFSILYILRSFFLLIFLTFVFAYIQVSFVNYIHRWIKNRKFCVIITAALLLCFFISVALFIIPSAKRQTSLFISQFGTYINRVDQEILGLSQKNSFIKRLLIELELTSNIVIGGNSYNGEKTISEPESSSIRQNSPVNTIFQRIIGLSSETEGGSNLNQVIEKFRNISGKIAAQIASVSSSFLLSLLFSFLIVFDLHNLTRLITDLKNTKLDFFYQEVAANIQNFAQVLGKALEAQLFIAIANSILTSLGLYFLGIGKYIAFLSVIVFFCSFVPVVGVFISSIPICLVALQASGLKSMIIAVILIVIIHIIEGYVLNPRIYGSYMRVNPVLVLIILTIGGKLFHIWGLMLGVPICTYIFAHAIRNKS